MSQRNVNYTPLTNDEQDVLSRLIDEGRELYVEVRALDCSGEDKRIVSEGFHPEPEITWGDKRIQVQFPLEFTRPSVLTPIHALHLQLKMRDESVLVDDIQPARGPNGNAIRIMEGTTLDLIWDVMIDRIPDRFQKRIRPGLTGKTIMRTSSDGVERLDEGD